MVPLKSLKKNVPSFITTSVSTSFSAFSCNRTPTDLWHNRLRHPSYERMMLLKQFCPLLTVEKKFVCHTCHHSKEKKKTTIFL